MVCELGEVGFSGGSVRDEGGRDVPTKVRTGGNELAVHRPMVVLAQGEAVGRVVVVAFGERNDVSGIDEGNATDRQLDAQSAGSALVVVDLQDLATESRAAAKTGLFLGCAADRSGRRRRGVEQPGRAERKVAGDERLAETPAVLGEPDEQVEAISEASVDLIEVGDERVAAQRRAAIGFKRQPEAVAGEVAERGFGGVVVVALADESQTPGKPVPQRLAPRNLVGCGEPLVEEIEDGEQEQRLVGALVPIMARPDDADAEVVEALDRLVDGGHARRSALAGSFGRCSSMSAHCWSIRSIRGLPGVFARLQACSWVASWSPSQWPHRSWWYRTWSSRPASAGSSMTGL